MEQVEHKNNVYTFEAPKVILASFSILGQRWNHLRMPISGIR